MGIRMIIKMATGKSTSRISIFLHLTAELAGKYVLISIFACLGICVGMWGILAGVYIGVKE